MSIAAASFAALVFCFWRTLSALALDWIRIDVARHGWAVVAVALALAWRNRAGFSSTTGAGAVLPGLAIILWGCAQSLAATVGVELFLGRSAFVITMAGVILFHFGWTALRHAAFPIVLFCLAIPLPAILYNPATATLQTIASQLTETILSIADVPLHWEGTAMIFGGETLRLIDAYGCLRLALALAAGALAYGEWINAGWRKRAALLAAVFLAAIALSSLRIVAVAWLDEPKPAMSSWILTRINAWIVLGAALLVTVASERLVWWRWQRSK